MAYQGLGQYRQTHSDSHSAVPPDPAAPQRRPSRASGSGLTYEAPGSGQGAHAEPGQLPHRGSACGGEGSALHRRASIVTPDKARPGTPISGDEAQAKASYELHRSVRRRASRFALSQEDFTPDPPEPCHTDSTTQPSCAPHSPHQPRHVTCDTSSSARPPTPAGGTSDDAASAAAYATRATSIRRRASRFAVEAVGWDDALNELEQESSDLFMHRSASSIDPRLSTASVPHSPLQDPAHSRGSPFHRRRRSTLAPDSHEPDSLDMFATDPAISAPTSQHRISDSANRHGRVSESSRGCESGPKPQVHRSGSYVPAAVAPGAGCSPRMGSFHSALNGLAVRQSDGPGLRTPSGTSQGGFVTSPGSPKVRFSRGLSKDGLLDSLDDNVPGLVGPSPRASLTGLCVGPRSAQHVQGPKQAVSARVSWASHGEKDALSDFMNSGLNIS